jgi:8-oxo-dGTP diphosphatase
MPRDSTEPSGWPPRMVVCAGAVVVKDERVLLIRHAPGQSLAGQWSIPWGVVDHGETPERAALREAHEEGGIIVELEGLLGVQNLPMSGWLGVAFLCRHLSGEASPDSVETDRSAYFSLAEIRTLGETLEPWSAWLIACCPAGHAPLRPVSKTPTSPGWPFSDCDTALETRDRHHQAMVCPPCVGWPSMPAMKLRSR